MNKTCFLPWLKCESALSKHNDRLHGFSLIKLWKPNKFDIAPGAWGGVPGVSGNPL